MDNISTNLDLDDLIVDLDDLDLNLDDNFIEVDNDLGEDSPTETSIGFDHLYSINPLGVNFNVILKEDPGIIVDVLGVFMNNIGIKGELKEMLIDCEVFLIHMKEKSKELLENNPKLYTYSSEIVETFEYNIRYIREELKMYKYDNVPVRRDTLAYKNFLKPGKSKEIIEIGKVNGREFKLQVMEDITGKGSVKVKDSPVYIYHNELESIIHLNNKFLDFIGFLYTVIGTDKGDSLSDLLKKSRVKDLEPVNLELYDKLRNIITFSNKSYSYTEDEYEAVKYLGFPYLICGKEEFIKSDLDSLLRDITHNMSKNTRTTRIEENKHKYNIQTLVWLKQIKVFFDNNINNNVGEIYF